MCLGHYVHVAFQDAVLKFANAANFYLLLISLMFRSNEQYMQFYNINTKEKYVPSDKNFTLFIILAVVTLLIFPATLKYKSPYK